MAGINLSQSTTGRQTSRRKFFDTGVVVSAIIFILVLGIWGGLYYFSFNTNKEVAGLQSQIDNSGIEMKGPKIDRILAFENRIEVVSKNTETQIDTSRILSDLEGLIIPSVRLTSYQYDHENGNISMEGVTSDFKFLAQQIISLKTNERYANIHVEKTNSESGDILFTLKSEGLK